MSEIQHEPTPHQEEMPFAIVEGEPYLKLPDDLYIPPDALEVFLETFEGPMDLLLYLIRRQNLDILDIPIAEVTRQYMEYIELMREMRLELAAEYLLMAAMLAEIKSRLLLPRVTETEAEEEDPRAELVRRLQEYERFKQAAENLEALPRMTRDFRVAQAFVAERKAVRVPPPVEIEQLVSAFRDVLERADLYSHHQIQREALSVRERMSRILIGLKTRPYTEFHFLFTPTEGRMGVVVTFLALLELLREQLVELIQNEPYAQIYVRSLAGEEPQAS